jgi:acetoacetate decarboxylase
MRCISTIIRRSPVADLPVLKVESALHYVTDLTLDLGTVVYDYLAQ